MSKPELKIEKIISGNGATPKKGDLVTVHYTGMFLNGKKFDSSVDRDEPFAFVLGAGQVIAGWDQGVVGMPVGGRRELIIPASLGYGAQSPGSGIAANDTLVFIVDLVKIN